MKFINNPVFNDEFEKISDIRFFPYVGKNYLSNEKKILVFAHNIPCPIEKFEMEQKRKSSKTHHANLLESFTYLGDKHTNTFRNFLKGSLSICENFNAKSSKEIIEKIDYFVERISYTNFINDLVPTNSMTNVYIEPKLITQSKRINNELIRILKPTHIICWGKHVYNYIINQDNLNIISSTKQLSEEKIGKRGFEYSKIEINDLQINLLKTFHPSMPGFGHKKESTHKILDWFYKLE